MNEQFEFVGNEHNKTYRLLHQTFVDVPQLLLGHFHFPKPTNSIRQYREMERTEQQPLLPFQKYHSEPVSV